MRIVLLSATTAIGLMAAGASIAQIQPIQPSDPRLTPQTQPGDVLSKVPQPRREGTSSSKGDGVTHGRNGDPIRATNDDQGRHGEAHSDPTLAKKPAPAADPKFQ